MSIPHRVQPTAHQNRTIAIRRAERGPAWESSCLLKGSFGPFGPKVARRVRNELPGPGGPKSPKRSRKRVKLSEGPKGGRRKGGRGRKLSHFSFCCAFRCCVVYSPCFPVWGEEKVVTIYDAGPLAAGPLCGLLTQSLAISALTEPNRQKSRRKKRSWAQKSQPEIANR